MASQKGLGKGLGALLGDYMDDPQQESAYRLLPIHKVEPNPDQPRHSFDETELQELADSIAQHGVIQPLTVREMPNGYFQIIAGERRWRASRLANLSEIPAVVIEADDKTAMELALIENLQRQDLNPVEEARGYDALISEYGMTQEEAAQRVGKSRSAVANALRLLTLAPVLRPMVEEGTLSAGHARALLPLSPTQQEAAARQIVAGDLSVRQTEALVKRLMAEKKEKKKPDTDAVDYTAEAQKALSSKLGRGVRIVTGRKKGRVELEYYGLDDLNDLLDALALIRMKKGGQAAESSQ